jgi:hypothetical protein
MRTHVLKKEHVNKVLGEVEVLRTIEAVRRRLAGEPEPSTVEWSPADYPIYVEFDTDRERFLCTLCKDTCLTDWEGAMLHFQSKEHVRKVGLQEVPELRDQGLRGKWAVEAGLPEFGPPGAKRIDLSDKLPALRKLLLVDDCETPPTSPEPHSTPGRAAPVLRVPLQTFRKFDENDFPHYVKYKWVADSSAAGGYDEYTCDHCKKVFYDFDSGQTHFAGKDHLKKVGYYEPAPHDTGLRGKAAVDRGLDAEGPPGRLLIQWPDG